MQVYLDHHATTPVDPDVLAEMLPYFSQTYGNAASVHAFGREAADAVDAARARTAGLIGAHPLEIVFTGGATESVNLALKGLADQYGDTRRHIITWVSEHPAVLDCCKELERRGFRITRLGLRPDGHIDLAALEGALDTETLAVSLMAADNEIGTLHDLSSVGVLARRHGAFFHCDASQALGKEALDVDGACVDLLSGSGHKMYGPKGVGFLYVRRKDPRVRLQAQVHGGGQERGLRSGTLNVPAIVGLGAACALAERVMAKDRVRIAALRDRLRDDLCAAGAVVVGPDDRRLAGNLNMRFEGVHAQDLLAAVPELALSTGAACTQALRGPSATLTALGLSAEQMRGHVRIGIGRHNTEAQLAYAGRRLVEAAAKCRTETRPADVCEL